MESVEALGKHLLIAIDGGWSLRAHLGMRGDVHRYRKEERWKRPRNDAVLVLETDSGLVFIWFEPAQAELYPTKMLRAHPQLSRLGPDLLAPDPDLDEAARRAGKFATLRGPCYAVGELMLNQSAAAGIGNIYKSETLFAERLSPLTPAVELSTAKLRALYATARELMLPHVNPGPRDAFKVYQRVGKPCPRCGTKITVIKQGPAARGTFYCPRCQPDPG